MATILSIDDDPELQDLVSLILKGRGHEVLWAFNGEEGISKAQEFNPDLIILDMMLPTLNGLEVLKLIKADPALKFIPVIVVTAFLGEGVFDEKGVRAEGASDFVRKPVQNDRLADLIDARLKDGKGRIFPAAGA